MVVEERTAAWEFWMNVAWQRKLVIDKSMDGVEDDDISDEAFEAELEALMHITISAKRRRNQRARVSSLPFEITAKVFSWVHKAYGHTERETLKWLVVSHVYSYWREIALKQVELWSFIPASHIPGPCSEEFLRRSRLAPLSIIYASARRPLDPLKAEAFHRIIAEGHERIESLRVPFDTVEQITVFSFPNLQSLLIQNHHPNSTSIHLFPEGYMERMPRLSCLLLHDCAFSWTSSVYANVTALSLHGTVSDAIHTPLTVAVLKTLFTKMQRLSSLSITNFAPNDMVFTEDGSPLPHCEIRPPRMLSTLSIFPTNSWKGVELATCLFPSRNMSIQVAPFRVPIRGFWTANGIQRCFRRHAGRSDPPYLLRISLNAPTKHTGRQYTMDVLCMKRLADGLAQRIIQYKHTLHVGSTIDPAIVPSLLGVDGHFSGIYLGEVVWLVLFLVSSYPTPFWKALFTAAPKVVRVEVCEHTLLTPTFIAALSPEMSAQGNVSLLPQLIRIMVTAPYRDSPSELLRNSYMELSTVLQARRRDGQSGMFAQICLPPHRAELPWAEEMKLAGLTAGPSGNPTA